MNSLLDTLCDEACWQEFLEYRRSKRFPHDDTAALECFVREKRWMPAAEAVLAGTPFVLPELKYVNKGNSGRKRAVYCFPETESFLLKHLAYRMEERYDSVLSDACWSFRSGRTVRGAFAAVCAVDRIDSRYVLKADIHDYFNSVPSKRLLAELEPVLADDPSLFRFFSQLLSADAFVHNGAVTAGERGILAGTAVSVFFANLWLKPVDDLFTAMGVPYFRYSDDILLFADSEAERDRLDELLLEKIQERGLAVNPDKYVKRGPGEGFEFLGFFRKDGEILLSPKTVEKIKGKIRRKARALYRWRIRKNVSAGKAAKRLIKVFNRKFYAGDDEDRLCWTEWYFPVITKDDGLLEIDRYLVQYVRWLFTGRQNNANYRVRYDTVKGLGYRSLRHAYWQRRKESYERLCKDHSVPEG